MGCDPPLGALSARDRTPLQKTRAPFQEVEANAPAENLPDTGIPGVPPAPLPGHNAASMLLQTNSYIVPRGKRAAHAKLLTQFRQTLARLGCDLFEVYEQASSEWTTETAGESRFVQIIRFRDRQHQLAIQSAEREDPVAQRMIGEFCEVINFPYQQEHGLFAVGFYTEMQAESEQPLIAPAALPPESPMPTDVQAYIARELDDIIATFGDPRQMLQEIAQANPAPSAPKERQAFPRLAQREQDPPTPPADDELDSLLLEQFAPATPAANPAAQDGDSDLARVLNEGLAEDALDIPMPAELLDENETETLGTIDRVSGAGASKPATKPAARPEPGSTKKHRRPTGS